MVSRFERVGFKAVSLGIDRDIVEMSEDDIEMPNGYIFTIGHGGRTAEELLELLQRENIEYVIDVRSRPYSRFQPEFCKGPLQGFLRRNKVGYVFMGDDLGGHPDDPSCYFDDGRVDYDACQTKAFFLRGIDRLLEARRQGLRICLLCSEGKPWECHRSKLIGQFLFDKKGVEISHFLPNGEIRLQKDVMVEVDHGQPGLFGNNLSSRKAYR